MSSEMEDEQGVKLIANKVDVKQLANLFKFFSHAPLKNDTRTGHEVVNGATYTPDFYCCYVATTF